MFVFSSSLLVVLIICVTIFGVLSFFILFKPKFGAELLEKAKVPWMFWGEGSDGLLALLVFVMFLFFSCILCFVLFYGWQAKSF